MSISIRRPLVPGVRRPLAARLVACGAVLAVALVAACQTPTEPAGRVTQGRVQVAPAPSGAPVTSEGTAPAPPDSAVGDTNSGQPNQQLIWW